MQTPTTYRQDQPEERMTIASMRLTGLGLRAITWAGFTAELDPNAALMRHSLINDQGNEMAHHRELTASTGVKVYFCDPHSPWQRGNYENTNGLLRQYPPKDADLSVHTQTELDAVADSLNNRLPATHAFRSPLEVFAAML